MGGRCVTAREPLAARSSWSSRPLSSSSSWARWSSSSRGRRMLLVVLADEVLHVVPRACERRFLHTGPAPIAATAGGRICAVVTPVWSTTFGLNHKHAAGLALHHHHLGAPQRDRPVVVGVPPQDEVGRHRDGGYEENEQEDPERDAPLDAEPPPAGAAALLHLGLLHGSARVREEREPRREPAALSRPRPGRTGRCAVLSPPTSYRRRSRGESQAPACRRPPGRPR